VSTSQKALNIVAIGLGQAGGNLAAEFQRRGYPALALNTASSDLDSLSSSGLSLPEEHRMYIGIDGFDGAGSDLNYGRECITTHAGQIRERVASHTAGADVVLVTAGLGGGTGSAVAELVKILEDLSLPVMVLATLPNDHESGIAKVNAVRAVNQLVKEALLGWMFVDNSRLAQAHGGVTLDHYYEEINKAIAEPLDAFNRMNAREGIRAIRTLDGEDFRTLLLSSGILSFTTTELPKLNVEGVIQAVRDGLKFSTLMPEGFSLETVSYMGVVIEAPADMMAHTPYTFFEQISEQLKDETGGAAIYMGVYQVPTGPALVRAICSTQALPEGIQEMVSAAKREGGQLRDKLQKTLTGLELGEIEEYELFKTSPGLIRRRITEPVRASSAPKARISVPPPPNRPISAAKPVSLTEETPVKRSRRDVTASAAEGASIPPPPTASTTDRDAYDQMVKDFKNSDSAEVRERITQRLEADRRSENSLIRYYAVRAMTKLDTELFSAALHAAMEDEDATVRAIATKALQR
jgi:cell division GTPase FtsZ